MARQSISEFLGTALMVGLGCGSVYYGASHEWISFTFAAAVTLAILLFGNISGAHINPAVSIAFWREGRIDNRQLRLYICGQLTGALFAAMLLGGAGPTTIAPNLTLLQAFTIEVVITMILMLSIFLVVQREPSIPVLALWVGATVGILAYFAGPETGASMNPARTFGPNIVSGLWPSLLFYSTSTILGAWLACDVKRLAFREK
ncbi:MAG TPA: aquaporin [Poseidonia sp.]|nr:aquaporin [Poseidonia sp.]